MNNVGFLYENGLGGFPKNTTQAIAWYQKAAKLGLPQAEASLKRLHEIVSNVVEN
jgi:TPR repeat protein